MFDFRQIPLSNIFRYLKLQGWKKRDDFPSDKLIVFDGPIELLNEPIQAVIPANENFKDYGIRVKELIDSLAILEERPIENIIIDIVSPSVDRLQVRIVSSLSKDGTLPLGYASKLISGLKDLLVAAACVEENPLPFYKKATKNAYNYADNCRFAQTKAGSFIITIESILPTYSQLELFDSEYAEPFSRRVIKRIQKGIGYVEQSVNEGEISIITDTYKYGLNANMCEALLKLKFEQFDVDLEYYVDWSKNFPKPKDVPKIAKITGNKAYGFIESAAKILRDSDESVKRDIVGKVVRLTALDLEDEENDNSANRYITIQTLINDKSLKVNIPLSIEDYKLACDAHRDNKDVKIHGIIERVGNRWQLMSPERFQILEPTR